MIGKIISHYKILEKLGEGGMGVVYKAQDTKLDRFVALKFLPPQLSQTDGEKQRFIHEAKAASALDHPNICTIYEIDEADDGQMFIAMACYKGELLKDKIVRAPLKLKEALDLASQILSGLERAHKAEIVHRDIKPANIMITEHREVKILDFGLAKLAGQSKLTKSGTTLGTTAYMSPEQARGEEMDRRSDLFSLGVVLFEMFTGQHPFKGDYDMAVLYAIMNEDPEPITSLRSGLPMALEHAVSKALEKDRGLRYQSASDLSADLKKIRTEAASAEKSTPPRVRKISGKWKPFLIPSVAILVLAAAFLLLQPIFREEPVISSPKPIAVLPFENKTGDKSLDYLKEVIPNLLITNLEQSRYLNLMTWERLQDLLKVAEKDLLVVDIDRETGFELCKMDGIHAIVLGSFTKAGDVFATDLKVLDVDTKNLLLGISAKGIGVGSILEHQIDELSKAISGGVAVQKREIKEDFRIADVSTKSIEAYRFYLEALKIYGRFFWGGAVVNFEKAIQLDSDFAMAHYYLARSYDRLHDSNSQNAAIKKALSFSEKATEKEALYIQTYYAWAIEKDAVKGFRLNEELVQKYPKEKQAHQDLAVKYRLAGRIQEAIAANERALELDPYWGNVYNDLGYEYALLEDYDKAERSFQKYIALSKGEANAFDSMGDFYFITGRLSDAVLNYELATESIPFSLSALTQLAFVHAIKEEYNQALEQFKKFIGDDPSPGWRGLEHRYRGLLYFYLGRHTEALELFQKQMLIVQGIGDEMGKAAGHELASFVYAESGRYNEAVSELQLCLKSRMRVASESGYRWRLSHQFLTGLIDVQVGNLEEAKQKLKAAKEETAGAKHKWHEFGTYWCALLEGEIVLAEGHLDQAIQIFEDVSPPNPWYLTWDGFATYRLPIARDGLARAYFAAGNLDKAIAEYQRLLTFNPKSKERFLINPKYHYRLAKLYDEIESTKLTIVEYQKFLNIWRNADPDLPYLIEARQRLTKLQRTSIKSEK